jgi:hypothetical protein
MDERDLSHLVKKSLDGVSGAMLPELDRRLQRHWTRQRISPPRHAGALSWRPAIAIVVLGLVFTLGSFWSKQSLELAELRADGPRVYSLEFSQPKLVAQSTRSPREAVHAAAQELLLTGMMTRARARDDFIDENIVLTHSIGQVVAQDVISTRESLPRQLIFETKPAQSFTLQFSAPSEEEMNMRLSVTLRSYAQPPQTDVTTDSQTASALPGDGLLVGASPPGAMASAVSHYSTVTTRSARVEITDERGNVYLVQQTALADLMQITPDGRQLVLLEGLQYPRALALDRAGNLYVLESGMGRILRVDAVDGEITPFSPIAVFALGFSTLLGVDRLRKRGVEELDPSYMFINELDEIYVGDATPRGTLVYKISPREPTPWWKFFCWYRC